MISDFVVTFLSAVQASISVLLTIGVGVGAAQFGILDSETSKRISQLSVQIFLPLLLFSNIGAEISLDTAVRYLPILVWAILYSITALLVSRAAVLLFRLPKWTVAAVTFNNTTSLPLLLVQSLRITGVLEKLLGPGVDDRDYDRIRSYFLVFAVVINVLTFGEGERALTGYNDRRFLFASVLGIFGDGRMKPDEAEQPSTSEDVEDGDYGVGSDGGYFSARVESDEVSEQAPLLQRRITPLLPTNITRHPQRLSNHISSAAARAWDSTPEGVKKCFRPLKPFVNPTTFGAVMGVFVGLTPPLHRLFFNSMHDGGYFHAWLTTPIKNVGELFVTLQVIVVGDSLSLSIRKRKRDREAGSIPRGTLIFVLVMRFIVFPTMSIPIIWALVRHTGVLSNDPALWFAMMLMPVGPPAMKLLALADVTDVDEEIELSIARLLTISYAVTPVISLAVVWALRTSEVLAT